MTKQAFDIDCVIIGAGVVGLAVARAVCLKGASVLVLEKETSFGTHTSARNSEVIHAGLYYPKDSLKGQFCLQGRDMLYAYCENHHVPHKKIGKYIVATSKSQFSVLESLQEKSAALGAGGLIWKDKAEMAKIEPALKCEAALFSEKTGIIDSHQYMLALLGDIEKNGGQLAVNSEAIDITPIDDGYGLTINCDEEEPYSLTTKAVINCGGLFAWDVASKLYEGANIPLPDKYLAKGTYFSYQKKSPFNHLIYPVPVDGGLGIHVTVDMGGAMKFGPDVEWIDTVNYTPNPVRKEEFLTAIRVYFPSITSDEIIEDYSGIRPKTTPPGTENDFVIEDLSEYGLKNCIHLFGIESPGLTSSLALAEHVSKSLTL